jgi:hypothetical protein
MVTTRNGLETSLGAGGEQEDSRLICAQSCWDDRLKGRSEIGGGDGNEATAGAGQRRGDALNGTLFRRVGSQPRRGSAP